MEGIPIQDLERGHVTSRQGHLRRIMRRRARTYLHPFFRTTHPTSERFLILSQMRSGSHLVRTLLCGHPSVHCSGELFAIRRALNPRLLLKNAMGARVEPVFGYMLKPHNPASDQGSTTMEWIQWMQNERFKLIHLFREDTLRQALSSYIAMERQVWIHRKGTPRHTGRTTIDVPRLLHFRRFIESWHAAESKWIDALPAVSFSYERDLRSADRHQPTADAIFQFLGVDSFPVEAQVEPVLPTDPREYVTNWEEVLAGWNAEDPSRVSA